MVSELLTTGQAARFCGVTSDAVLKWIKKGKLPAIRTAGGHFRIDRRVLESFAGTACRPGERHGDVSPPAMPPFCWEYYWRDAPPPDACRKCVVYRARIERCYEVAELGGAIGHERRFCRATCDDCSFFRASKGLATPVLVVTGDESWIERLARQAPDANLAVRFARSGYESSMAVDTFHPSVVALDSALPEVRDGRLVVSMRGDDRLPGVRIVVARRKGHRIKQDEDEGHRVTVILAPFTAQELEHHIQSLMRLAPLPDGCPDRDFITANEDLGSGRSRRR